MKCRSNDWAVQLMLSWAMLLVVVLLCSQSVGAGSSSSSPRLKVATCQFSVSGDVDENARYVKGFIKEASANKADIVHFSEAALSGYARVDFQDFDGYDWAKLRTHTQEIMGLAREHRIWVVVGSAHYLSAAEKPMNCLYIISSEGKSLIDTISRCAREAI